MNRSRDASRDIHEIRGLSATRLASYIGGIE
jgi:hypothetical protein